MVPRSVFGPDTVLAFGKKPVLRVAVGVVFAWWFYLSAALALFRALLNPHSLAHASYTRPSCPALDAVGLESVSACCALLEATMGQRAITRAAVLEV